MKVISLAVVAMMILGGCVAGNLVTDFDAKIGNMADTVYSQKDCRAGLLSSLILVRSPSLEVKTSIASMVSMADPNSEAFKRCAYLGSVANAYRFMSGDLIKANTEILQAVMGMVP